jgi:hypothetical protein
MAKPPAKIDQLKMIRSPYSFSLASSMAIGPPVNSAPETREPLQTARQWMDGISAQWEDALGHLKEIVES